MGSSNLESLFQKYKEKERDPYRYLESTWKCFPKGQIMKSQLQMYYKKDGTFHSFGWLTSVGFCYGVYLKETFDKIVNKFTIFPFFRNTKDGVMPGTDEDYPSSVCHSEFHIFYLYPDCLIVISKVSHNVVYTEQLPEGEKNMVYSKFKSCLYIQVSKELYCLQIENESRDVWEAYLEKKDFENAMQQCKQKGNKSNLKKVFKAWANDYFDTGDYNKSALLFSESDERFEHVTLKFLKSNQFEGLKVYLLAVEKNIQDHSTITQKTLITTWLTEIFLHELNSTKDSADFRKLKDKFMNFMKDNINNLDAETIYELLTRYGRSNELLDFAALKEDFEIVVQHYIYNKSYAKAIEHLNNFIEQKLETNSNPDSINNLYKIFDKYSHIFMKYEPELTINKLLKNLKNSIDTNRIISALINIDSNKKEKIIDFLEDFMKTPKGRDKNIHNLYLCYLSQIKSESSIKALMSYLYTSLQRGIIYFEVDYALKIFCQEEIYQAEALAFTIIGKLDKAVEVALKNNYVDVAKIITTFADDPITKRQLWYEIFANEMNEESKKISESGLSQSKAILKESKVLRVEDILPGLKDEVKIDVFKNEIFDCLNSYEVEIENLKSEIYERDETTKTVKSDIAQVKKKYMELRSQVCICEVCNNAIAEDSIYIFACGHMFDEECIIHLLKDYSTVLGPKMKLRSLHIKELKEDIEEMSLRKEQSNITEEEVSSRGTFFNFIGIGSDSKQTIGAKRITISSDELKILEDMKINYKEELLEECLLCGDSSVDLIAAPLKVDEDESWIIKN